MVGFPVEMTDAGLARAMQTYLAGCTFSDLDPADVVCLVRDDSGAELRIALKKGTTGQAQVVSMDPAFAGQGRPPVEILSDVSDPAERPFELTFTARFSGVSTPLVFDLADPAEAAKLQPGAKVTIDITAFSFEPRVYADEAAFDRDQDKSAVRLAANAFIPTGMLFERVGGAMPDGATRPVGYADFASKVLKAELRTNRAGSGRFWWALVQTYGGATFDVVADPNALHDAPKPGAIIAGRFWLSARLVPSL
jgi:hypothetical protein